MTDLNERVNNVVAELKLINQILEDEDFVCCHGWRIRRPCILDRIEVSCSFQTGINSVKEFREGCKICREQARKRLKEMVK